MLPLPSRSSTAGRPTAAAERHMAAPRHNKASECLLVLRLRLFLMEGTCSEEAAKGNKRSNFPSNNHSQLPPDPQPPIPPCSPARSTPPPFCLVISRRLHNAQSGFASRFFGVHRIYFSEPRAAYPCSAALGFPVSVSLARRMASRSSVALFERHTGSSGTKPLRNLLPCEPARRLESLEAAACASRRKSWFDRGIPKFIMLKKCEKHTHNTLSVTQS